MIYGTSFSRRQFNTLFGNTGLAAVAAWFAPAVEYASESGVRLGRPPNFVHPGMLHNMADLRRMRAAVRNTTQPIFAGFEKLRDDPPSQLSYQPAGASEEVGRNPNIRIRMFDSDANAAYQTALMGHITQNSAYFGLCAHILDDWADKLKRVTGADAILCATLGGFKFANAAELLRCGRNGWRSDKAERFGTMLRQVLLPVLYNFAPFANGNWDTAAIKTMMAIAIYTDDRELFERALIYYLHGCGDGSLGHYIYASGQCQESGRDQQHTQLGIAHMGDCCEMARHQGVDLYGALDNRLLLGFEYTSRYLLGEGVPFAPDSDRTGKYMHAAISPRSALRNNFEQIYNHYVNRRGLPAPWTQKAAEKVRPEGAGNQADNTGFGTLLYTRPPGRDTEIPTVAATVSGVYASLQPGAVRVEWARQAASSSYAVIRTDAFGRSARRLTVAPGANEVVDTSAEPGQRYVYHVSVADSQRLSVPVTVVAALPAGWQTSVAGPASLTGSAVFDGTTWRLEAAGVPPSSSWDGSVYAVHTELPSEASFTARLSPIFASQALHTGIAVFNEREGIHCASMLLLEPATHFLTEQIGWIVRYYMRSSDGGDLVLCGERHIGEPAVSYGRVYLPLWFRLDVQSDAIHASFSLDGQSYTSLATGPSIKGRARAGLVLNSGLSAIRTSVAFDRVSVERA